ncbi:hypothetical protein COM60_07110 [Bacillus toyonensis]|uniref:DUF5677 domain-containing protein n=1 Tax=Bacillus toyonensis TaxID=155322 RepID=UPI000BF59B1A|nr:DUF5677 domain-containing protein [Bacillus toyonensis]PGE40384.1 hypothetical protein COM60_07110 [Bacillus toyonensis]
METNLESLNRSLKFGEDLIEKLKQKSNLKLEEKIVITLYNKLMEQVDGSFILIDYKSDGPAKVMLRAGFETYISMDYILKDPLLLQQRAFSYYISFIKDQLKKVEENGTEEQILITNQAFSEVLASPSFQDILSEWAQKKGGSLYNPKWYSLFNGPSNIKQLTDLMGDSNSGIYKYYGLLSQEAHGYQALNSANYVDFITDFLTLEPIRKEELDDVDIQVAKALCTGGTGMIIMKLFPEFRADFGLLLNEMGLI